LDSSGFWFSPTIIKKIVEVCDKVGGLFNKGRRIEEKKLLFNPFFI